MNESDDAPKPATDIEIISISLSKSQWEDVLRDMEFAAATGDCSSEEAGRSTARMDWIRSILSVNGQ